MGIVRLLALIISMVLAGEAFAQFGGPFGRGGARGGVVRPDRNDSRNDARNDFPLRANPAERLTQQLDMLREDLKLTLVQEKAWTVYADKVLAIADDVSRERNRPASGMKVMQRLDRSVDSARNRMTALEEVSAAAKKLYDQLTPDQQVTADPRLATLVQEATLEASVLPSGAGSARQRSPRD
jgi:hypothetical protein